MGYYCTVPQCTSLAGKTKNVKFHRFPRDVTMANKWNLILKRGKPYTKYSKVCSLHFTQADYNVTTMGQWKTLSKDAVPSQNLPKLDADGNVMVIRKSRTVKYRDGRKEESCGKTDSKWMMQNQQALPLTVASEVPGSIPEVQDANLAYRLQTLSAIASAISPQSQTLPLTHLKPKKQDAIMQTDPEQSEEDDSQNTTYDTEKPFTDEQYPIQQYPKEDSAKSYDTPKDYTKSEEDYIPQTNEEYNNEAEKYALERKSLNGYEKVSEVYTNPKIAPVDYQKVDMYAFNDKYPNRTDTWYSNGYPDSVEMLRNQQHNLQMLQEQHRINENQNFFNENHIKQEIDINNDEETFMYERQKNALDANTLISRYEDGKRQHQQRAPELHHHVKQEPDGSDAHSAPAGCDSVLQPQGSPYYAGNGQDNVTSGYYEQLHRPGPELLIAKQNALAAHTQLWQNTMKRPFFYSENPHYTSPPLLHRYEDLSRILQ
ncbi:unnamed protein product [Diatraea saccharalis]|uniref:THAP-type domain-containing protein n=1 Tax=Diatraea saccharalis TaxID=40085 RepID=A0A9N9WKD8_9NEOP|nr:unnamed protein product [Diatraea saccharalis]